MLGQRYFDARTGLSNAVTELAELAEQSGIDPARVALLRSLLGSLRDPFLFVVVGEVNAGKSTLLNGLFGEDFCSADVVPTTDRICYFKYDDEPREVEISESLIEIYRPAEFLADFHVVDTPGTNSIERHHQQITEEFVPRADLVLFVFSVTNPWGAASWDLLDKIHTDWRRNVAFVLQQCDTRTDEEIEAILEHLNRTTEERYGQTFPTYAVSAKKALLAKTSGVDKDRLRGESGFDPFERYISQIVESSETRTTKLVNAWRSACTVLDELDQKLRNASEVIRVDEELLSGLDDAARAQQDRTLKKFDPLFDALDKSFMAAGIKSGQVLESHLDILSSLKSAEDQPSHIEEQVRSETLHSVRNNVVGASAVVRDDVVHLWERLALDMQQHFGFKLSVGETGQPDWSSSEMRLCGQVEEASKKALEEMRLAHPLREIFVARRLNSWVFLGLTLLFAAVGGLLAWQSLHPWHLVSFSVSAVALLIGAILGNRSVNRIRERYGDTLETTRIALQEAQGRAFGTGTESFFHDFVELFAPLRKVCQDHRETYGPQLERKARLRAEFNALSEDLARAEEEVNAHANLDPLTQQASST